MIPKNVSKSEQVLSELADHGYSEKVAEAIWRWYHPSMPIKTGF